MIRLFSILICILLFLNLIGCTKKTVTENAEKNVSSNKSVTPKVKETKNVLNTEIAVTPLATVTSVPTKDIISTPAHVSMKTSSELAKIYNLSIEVVDILKEKASRSSSNPKIFEEHLEGYSKGKLNLVNIQVYSVLKKRYQSKEIDLKKAEKLYDEGYSILDMTMAEVLSYYCKKSSEEIMVLRGKDNKKNTWENVSKQINVNFSIIPEEFKKDPTTADIQIVE
jgi:hypothetical protein